MVFGERMQIKTDVSMLKSNGPAREFLDFCKIEVERQLNSGKEFDPVAFNAAVELVIKRLKNMELEGLV